MYKLASAAIIAAAAAGSVMAQGQSPAPSFSLPFGLSFSPQCQAAVVGVITNSDFAKCFPITDILPAISGNDSLVPYLDKFMTDLCYNYPVCSDDTLKAAAQAVLAGCSADLQKDGFSDQVVVDAFSAYPIVREVLCLKTTDPYTAQSYGGFLGPPAIPIVGNPIYNSTNGTFCVTSVATQLSAYFGTNITVPFLGSIISGQNATALQLATSINPNIVCNTCFFAALEVVDLVVPAVGQTPVAAVLKIFGATVPSLGQTTIDQLFDWTCAYKPLALSTNGQLPNGISVSIVDSTYPATLMDGTMSGGANGCKRALFGRKI